MSKNATVLAHVNRYSTDGEVRAELIGMLGLLNADGSLAEDDTRSVSMEQVNTSGGGPKMRETEAWFLDKPDVSTAPEALRNLAPVVVEPKQKPAAAPKPAKVKKQAPTKKVSEGRKSRAKGTARTRPPSGTRCGTLRGYDDHVHYGEAQCQPCRDVMAKRRLEQRRRAAFAKTGVMPTGRAEAVCGSRYGERKHRRRGEKVCDPCRIAHNVEIARRRKLNTARKQEQQ